MSIIVDSYIDGEFTGWTGETLFKLGNGQYWMQQVMRMYIAFRPRVHIVKENGRLLLKVFGLNETLPVRLITDVIESGIEDEFTGWDDETKFELQNGQIWQQVSYAYTYHYAYRPSVVIYSPGNGYRLKVEGMNDIIEVRRIR